MRTRARTLAAPLLALSLLAIYPADAAAERSHRVRAGQTLAQIARRYGVPIQSLAGANEMSLRSNLREGQVLRIPDPGTVYVMAGQTLSHIARAHDVSIEDLRRANRLRPNARLSVGQRLILPGHVDTAAAAQWGRTRTPGVATVIRNNTHDRRRIRIIDRRGRFDSTSVTKLQHLMRHATGASPEPPERLLRLLAQLSDHFGGRPIYLMSGFRPPGESTRNSSQHVHGHALDLSIHGVPNEAVRDWCREQRRVGCGFYPNSSFVHIDVRDRSRYWIDHSGPGEAPQYERHADGPPGE